MALWTPADLGAALQLWFDAKDTATITHSSGVVSQWADKSGNARHATQATEANKPTYSATGYNGQDGIVFDPDTGDQYLQLPDLSGTGWTAAGVYNTSKIDTDPPGAGRKTGPRVGALGTAGAADVDPWTDGVLYHGAFSDTRHTTTDPTTAFTSPHIEGIQSAANNWTYWIDGIQHFNTSSNTFALGSAPRIGNNGSGNYLEGAIGEIVIVSGTLSTGDRQKVEGYLAHRWGTTGGLDAGHPYKSSAPTTGGGPNIPAIMRHYRQMRT